MTRNEIYLAILLNARVVYKINDGTQLEGIVIGDSFYRMNGKFHYHIVVKDRHAYSVSSVDPQDIIGVISWNVPEERLVRYLADVPQYINRLYADGEALIKGAVSEREILEIK